MFEKTLGLISSYPPATYVADDVESFDVEEMSYLGRLLSRLLYSPSSIRKFLQDKFGVTITRADFYSEIPRITELEESFKSKSLLTLDQIFPDNALMVEELMRLMPAAEEFAPPETTTSPTEYAWKNDLFSFSDAMSYYAMIRTRQPNVIVEIGSGWSTRIARLACERNGRGRIICIEPYPSNELKQLPNVTIIEKRAQEIETNFLNEILHDGDMLFIDSTHTVKHDGDCLHIYLRLLPNVEKNVTVHVHDIRLPNTLPLSQMRDSQIFWNEQYLLYMYLLLHSHVKILYGSAYHDKFNRNLLDRFMHGRFPAGGASIWFEQRGLKLRKS